MKLEQERGLERGCDRALVCVCGGEREGGPAQEGDSRSPVPGGEPWVVGGTQLIVLKATQASSDVLQEIADSEHRGKKNPQGSQSKVSCTVTKNPGAGRGVGGKQEGP